MPSHRHGPYHIVHDNTTISLNLITKIVISQYLCASFALINKSSTSEHQPDFSVFCCLNEVPEASILCDNRKERWVEFPATKRIYSIKPLFMEGIAHSVYIFGCLCLDWWLVLHHWRANGNSSSFPWASGCPPRWSGWRCVCCGRCWTRSGSVTRLVKESQYMSHKYINIIFSAL